MCDNVEEEKCEEESARLNLKVADFTLNNLDNNKRSESNEEVIGSESELENIFPSHIPTEMLEEHLTARVSMIERKMMRRVHIATVAES